MAALLACILACCLAFPAAAWNEFGIENEPEPEVDGDVIREPFFEFLMFVVEADSFGSWTGVDLASYLAESGRPSKFPLDQLVSIDRMPPSPAILADFEYSDVRAEWRLVLTGDLDRPMPYSILGYHPGSLRIGGDLALVELGPQNISLRLDDGDGGYRRKTIHEYRVFVLTQGYLLLDADGWLDALLGAGLDDAWIVGFVTAREEGQRVGLGVSVGRDGRRIYGEFDFAHDRILPNGRQEAAAMSRVSRAWLNPASGSLPTPWVIDNP